MEAQFARADVTGVASSRRKASSEDLLSEKLNAPIAASVVALGKCALGDISTSLSQACLL